MKTAHISTPTHEIMLVEVPNSIKDGLLADKERIYTNYWLGINILKEHLPEGNWTDLGFVSDLKESEVEVLVEISFDTPRMYRDYKHNLPGLTALHSFLSLLETKVMWENPIEYPKQGSYEALMTTNWDGLNKRWDDAQSRTFDKARTIVLVKEK